MITGLPKPGMYFLLLDVDIQVLHRLSSAHLRPQTSGHAGAWL
jgi:hypothetical protein